MRLAMLAVLACAVILAGCINQVVEIDNVKITVTKYEGDCMPPVSKIPCCVDYPQKGLEVLVDGVKYTTDSNGQVLAKLDVNKTHFIQYKGCSGQNETLRVDVLQGSLSYEKTVVYGNSAYAKQNASDRQNVEINLPCCTA